MVKGFYSNVFNLIMALSLVGLFFFVPGMASAKAVCTRLTTDMDYEATNSGTGGQVRILQEFLRAAGYLAAAPSGRYGEATVAAVKKFQLAKSIMSTGKTGPATRAAIEKVSCSSVAASKSPVAVTSVSSPKIKPAAVPVVKAATALKTAVPAVVASPIVTTSFSGATNNLIVAPAAGTVLTVGQKYTITWVGSISTNAVNIFLEDEHGGGIGYVRNSFPGSAKSFDWTVGNVSIGGKPSVLVPPGNYRLRVSNSYFTSGSSIFEGKSGVFSIREKPLIINNILPSTISAGEQETIVLHGEGFNGLTKIRLTGPRIVTASPLYVSSDGKNIVFSNPGSLLVGQYSLSAFNDYASLDDASTVGTPSNAVALQVGQ